MPYAPSRHRVPSFWVGLGLLSLAAPAVSGARMAAAPQQEGAPASRPSEVAEGAASEGVPVPEDLRQGEAILPAGHRRMVALLADIARRSPAEHPNLNTLRVRQLRRKLDANAGGTSPDVESKTLLALGKAELRIADYDGAVRDLTRAWEQLPEAQRGAPAGRHTAYELGLAYLRLAIHENGQIAPAPTSEVLPPPLLSVHRDPRPARMAASFLQAALVPPVPDSTLMLKARWLLNLAHMAAGTFPDGVPEYARIHPRALQSPVTLPRFRNVAPALGIAALNLCGGVVIDDIDDDSYLDIVTSTSDPKGPMHVYRNTGNGTFEDRTSVAHLDHHLGGLNLVDADYDNDGDLDILVLRGAWMRKYGRQPNSLLCNRGDGTFIDVTFEAGLGEVHFPTQTAAWADYDADGDLDLYIGNEASPDLPAPCQLFRNEGDGTFVDVAASAGVTNDRFTKGVVWGDADGDHDPDIYVSNGGAPNRLYRNEGDGTFTDVAVELAVAGPRDSFPLWFWDFDNDGILDIFVASYNSRIETIASYFLGQPTRFDLPRLYRGTGGGHFENVARQRGFHTPMLPMGANFGDLDNDGFLDVYLGTGDTLLESLMPNVLFLNLKGQRFVDVTMSGGFANLQKGHGVSFADIDNDGDLDVFEQMGGSFAADVFGDVLLENPGFGNGSVTVELRGVLSNRSAIGAEITALIDAGVETRRVHRVVSSGGSFGANPLLETIGLGHAGEIRELRILWPTTGKTQAVAHVPAGSRIRIVEGEDGWKPIPGKPLRFDDGSRSHSP